jgi:RHH-type proline utilization regulon transcriptional repressor/proline dehydrogenase/delta 1-pyrroline-5-carboxylate dehydrogenase
VKAGGPNYVAQFMAFEDAAMAASKELPETAKLKEYCLQLRARAIAHGLKEQEVTRIIAAATSFDHQHRVQFGQRHDHFRLVGQDNFRRYLPFHELRVRVDPADSAFDLFARVCAAHAAGCRITVSVPADFSSPALKLLEEITEPWAGGIEFVEETDPELAHAMRSRQTDRVRYAAPDRVPLVVLEASANSGVCAVSTPVVAEGRLELLCYVQEQSISIDYHRYGNLGRRAAEARTEPG